MRSPLLLCAPGVGPDLELEVLCKSSVLKDPILGVAWRDLCAQSVTLSACSRAGLHSGSCFGSVYLPDKRRTAFLDPCLPDCLLALTNAKSTYTPIER